MSTAVEVAATRTERPRIREVIAAPWSDQHDAGLARQNLRSHLLRGTGRLVALLSLDLVTIAAARLIRRSVRLGSLGAGPAEWVNAVLPAGAVSSAQLSIAIAASLLFYGCYRDGDRWRDPAKILGATAAGIVIALYAELWQQASAQVVLRALLLWLSTAPLLVLARSLAGALTARWNGGGLERRVLEVTGGDEDVALDLGPSYNFVASVDHREIPADARTMEQWLSGRIDTIVVRGEMPGDRFHLLTDFALTHGCRLLCAPYSGQLLGVEKKRIWVEGHPLIELTTPALRASHLVLKRGLDVTAAVLAVIVLSPLIAGVALWIKVDSRGPVLFRQRRPGIRGRPFSMLKFRSMRADAEDLLFGDARMHERFLGNGCKLPEHEDPRVTRVGRFLRKRSLDELPQLFNVIRGDMSLVGPRPLVGPELENYGGRVPVLLSVKPGMTGLWQVSGRSTVQFPERAEMDLEYVRNWSFLGDLWILLLTPFVVLAGRGAH